MIKGKYARSLCVTLLLTACLLLIFGAVGGTAHLTIHFIDVGQGDSILIQTPTGAAILVEEQRFWLTRAIPEPVRMWLCPI